MFVSREPVPVCVDPPDTPDDQRNIIFIRPKMDFGTKQRVQAAVVHLTRGMDREALKRAPVDLGAANIALLVQNIVRWQGPAFKDDYGNPILCNAEHIEQLDSDEPLVDAVLAEINRRNPGKGDEDDAEASAEKNGSTSAGDPSLLANAKTP